MQLLEPIQSAIPDAFSDIIDVEDMFDKVLEKIVGAAIDKGEKHFDWSQQGVTVFNLHLFIMCLYSVSISST